jgi:hypothetical protein
MYQRKTTPKVRDGRVQKKNRAEPTANYYLGNLAEFVIDRERPGEGHRHVLLKRDVESFIAILPDWQELSVGLNAIVLAAGNPDCLGWHTPGVVSVCAWDRDLWVEWPHDFVEEHRDLTVRLGVPCESRHDRVLCKFNESTVRAFQLLHILLHELGHHHDRITTRSRRQASRGEGFAEDYAARYENQIFSRYLEVFSLE